MNGANRVGLERLGIDGTTVETWHHELGAGKVVGAEHPDLSVHVARYRAALGGTPEVH